MPSNKLTILTGHTIPQDHSFASGYDGSSQKDCARRFRGVDICAKLVTICQGRKETINLTYSKPAIIGRNPELCSYVVSDALVSGVHCKLYAVRSPCGGTIVSCQDLSRNGLLLNDQHIRKTSILLMDGDVIQLPNSLSFTCIHMKTEPADKLSLFEPTPPLQPIQKKIGNYIVTSQCLGTGSFATVHLALDPDNHRQVACKSIRTKRESEIVQVMKEVRILMTLKHPNINEIYATEENKKFIHIFLQLCTGGDLFTYITNATGAGSRICEAEAKYIMYQLLEALEYLHEKSISHRDLKAKNNTKPENILLHCPGPYPRILIADFGLARPNSYQETFNVCGTVSYLPPEGILALDNKHLGYIGMPSDCWSAGVILYIMLCGAHPFDNEPRPSSRSVVWSQDDHVNHAHADVRVKEKIIYSDVEYFEDPWKELDDARSLVDALLIRDPLKRMTIQGALAHIWIRAEIDDLEALYRLRIISQL